MAPWQQQARESQWLGSMQGVWERRGGCRESEGVEHKEHAGSGKAAGSMQECAGSIKYKVKACRTRRHQ